jgi:hypothetical protein
VILLDKGPNCGRFFSNPRIGPGGLPPGGNGTLHLSVGWSEVMQTILPLGHVPTCWRSSIAICTNLEGL